MHQRNHFQLLLSLRLNLAQTHLGIYFYKSENSSASTYLLRNAGQFSYLLKTVQELLSLIPMTEIYERISDPWFSFAYQRSVI